MRLIEAIRTHSENSKPPDGKEYVSLSSLHVDRIAAQTNQTFREVEAEALRNNIVPERYSRNIGTVGIEGQLKLLESRVAVVGAGGLGGTVLELLARFGIGKLAVVDKDVFADSNLNRQILSNMENLGEYKVVAGRKRVEIVNPSVDVEIWPAYAHQGNLPEIMAGCQVVVDALDSIPARFALEKTAKNMGVPLVHGAIAGFLGQVMSIFPEDEGLMNVYDPEQPGESGIEKGLGTPCVTPFMVASLQASEVIKILLGWQGICRNRLFIIDMKKMVTDSIHFRSAPHAS